MWVQTLVLFATAFAATSASPSGASTVADRLYIFNNNSYCGGDKWTCVNKPLGVSLTSTHCSLCTLASIKENNGCPELPSHVSIVMHTFVSLD